MSFAERLDAIRDKPHHVRQRVAFGLAGGVTAVIALVWLGASLATGAFAIKGSNFAELTGAQAATTTDASMGGPDAVAGAAAAAPDTGGPAALQVLPSGDTNADGAAASPAAASDPSNGQTIIPF